MLKGNHLSVSDAAGSKRSSPPGNELCVRGAHSKEGRGAEEQRRRRKGREEGS